MNEKHEITNDFKIDAIKDNFTPPKMTEIREDATEHLLSGLGLSFNDFFADIKKSGEYLTDDGIIHFWTSDVIKFIRILNPQDDE